ncbi:hypothetical protein M231_00493 [Tremella mesenterica]|uniref:Uncharacterized protein n=1 Tax=Tremella mesenterica TaxID=5217 RepID=A0A4Q1BVR9_TREME|nr:hypothetical protein M231_00493 [Tremella mesenterica]
MRFLDEPALARLSENMTYQPSPELGVYARFEAYSEKLSGRQRKSYRDMEKVHKRDQDGMAIMAFSPEMREAGLMSCFGRLDEKESRKVHFLLVSTLNCAYPDHDFSSLRPDHFTREPAAAAVIGHLCGSLLGPVGALPAIPRLGSSPNTPGSHSHSSPPAMNAMPPPGMINSDLYRILNDIVPLAECEVYSWFPEPEYDPHLLEDDDEESEMGIEEEDPLEELIDRKMDVDVDGPEIYEQAGIVMDMDDVPVPVPMIRKPSTSGQANTEKVLSTPPPKPKGGETVRERPKGALLWSANYFFYSKRQKRVLFITCWCRKRHLHSLSTSTAFPLPISSSLGSSSSGPTSVPLFARTIRQPKPMTSPISRLAYRRSKLNLRPKADMSGTIPIRGMETYQRTGRLASSAPSSSPLITSNQSRFDKMKTGGFKPHQTPARTVLNAANVSGMPPKVMSTATSALSEKIRKDRSESTTPGRNVGMVGNVEKVKDAENSVEESKGKKTKI